jgi:hypothetical protein
MAHRRCAEDAEKINYSAATCCVTGVSDRLIEVFIKAVGPLGAVIVRRKQIAIVSRCLSKVPYRRPCEIN